VHRTSLITKITTADIVWMPAVDLLRVPPRDRALSENVP